MTLQTTIVANDFPVQVLARLGDVHLATSSKLQHAALTIREWEAAPGRKLSERLVAGAAMSFLTKQINERTYDALDLHDARATQRIKARSR